MEEYYRIAEYIYLDSVRDHFRKIFNQSVELTEVDPSCLLSLPLLPSQKRIIMSIPESKFILNFVIELRDLIKQEKQIRYFEKVRTTPPSPRALSYF